MKRLHALLLTLLLLTAGAMPSWAWNSETSYSDAGGGNYVFKHNGGTMAYWISGAWYNFGGVKKNLGADNMRAFQTHQFFDNAAGRYNYIFGMRVCFQTICGESNKDRKATWFSAEMYAVTKSGAWRTLCYFKKNSNDDKIYISGENFDYGRVISTDEDNNGYIKLSFQPGNRLIEEGITKIRFKIDRFYYRDRSWGGYEYEKSLDQGYTGMPEPTYEWGDNGRLVLKAKGVPKGVGDYANCRIQAYRTEESFQMNNKEYVVTHPFEIKKEHRSNPSGNKTDVSGTYVQPTYPPYTTPVYIVATPSTTVNNVLGGSPGTFAWTDKDYEHVIAPYTSPTNLQAEFNQWKKTVTVKWDRVAKVNYYRRNVQKGVITCKTDGMWYVLRYDPDKNIYEELSSFRSDKNSFSYTDDQGSYEKQYTYRVVFLPKVLESKYSSKVYEMPFNSLYQQQTVSTKRYVNIQLTQDRSDSTGVKLVWTYNIQSDDAKFSVQRRPVGSEDSWQTIAQNISSDPDQASASYIDSKVNSFCDHEEYRILVDVMGTSFSSNIIVGSLPKGTTITSIDATKGTKDGFVIVKWKVDQKGTDETKFSIRRRILGSEEEFTEIGTMQGNASEYTFNDERSMAGTYYEYMIAGEGTSCEDQYITSTTTPGFSQAKGTITGHISFGSGTAVKDVRVKLVKSSEDEDNTVQYLSRFFEGEGGGLSWTPDSARYDKLLNGQKPFTLQLWARPSDSDNRKMALAQVNNAFEIGLKRINDISVYETKIPASEAYKQSIEEQRKQAELDAQNAYKTALAEYTQSLYDDQGRFVISNAEEWNIFANIVNEGATTTNAILNADINLDATSGFISKSYQGIFDGNGHTIRLSGKLSPLFGYLLGATVKNLNVQGKLTLSLPFAGILALIAENTTFQSCQNGAVLENLHKISDKYTAGYVGRGTNLTFQDCVFNGVMLSPDGGINLGISKYTPGNYINGYIGEANGNNTFKNCYSSFEIPLSVSNLDEDYSFAKNAILDNCYQRNYRIRLQGIDAFGMSPSDIAVALGSGWTYSEISAIPLLSSTPLAFNPLPRPDRNNFKAVEIPMTDFRNFATGEVIRRSQLTEVADTLYCPYLLDLTGSSHDSYKLTEFPNLPLSVNDFTHIAVSYNDGKWMLAVGSDSLRRDTIAAVDTNWRACPKKGTQVLTIAANNRLTGSAFKGYADDVRLWSRALSEKEIQSGYTRILGGTENGLQLYWPLDEGLKVTGHAFDIACQDGIYLENHPVVGVNAMPSANVPSQLRLYGLTDAEGDYIIKGVPFQEGGTNYKIVPDLGIHEFDPISRSMYVSPTSLTANNVDFTDKSSFIMRGYVYYAGTNIPSEKIQLYVDGQLLTQEGKVQQTDANGFYEISVPIGKHYVEAKSERRKMVGGGRFPLNGTFNFDREVRYDFADSTLVNFVGRVAGGEAQDTIPVGFGCSKNNLGIATVKLRLGNESLSFNCADDHISDAKDIRTFDSDTVTINSHTYTGKGTESKYIYITTDSLTGEFSALLPPLKYQVESVTLVNNRDNIEFEKPADIDMSNILTDHFDTLRVGNSMTNSRQEYHYNSKLVKTHFAEPVIDMLQKGNAKDAFGLRELMNFEDEYGTTDITDLYTVDTDGKVSYRFGYPLYQKGRRATVTLHGYEVYRNYDGKEVVIDTVALNNQIITIANELSADQTVVFRVDRPESNLNVGEVVDLKSNQLRLDADGRAEYEWTTGMANVVEPYTRQLSMTYIRKDRTYNGPTLNAIVMGVLPTGNNFVTAGPDKLLMVLRDPPGAQSKTTWKTGRTNTKFTYKTSGVLGNEKYYYTSWEGIGTDTYNGIGVAVGTKAYVGMHSLGGVHLTMNRTDTNEETYSTTLSQSISTSSDKLFVGAKGDVFIGTSTNLLMGACRKVGLFRDGKDAPFYIKLDDAISLGDTVTTSFSYTEYELETVMIPKWEDVRRSYLTRETTKEAAKNFVNNTEKYVYTTWLDPDTMTVFKESETYFCIPPANVKEGMLNDSVNWCSMQISQWKERMADNERDKVKAMKGGRNSGEGSYWKENLSFDGGTSRSYSNRVDTVKTDKTTKSWTVTALIKVGNSGEATLPAAKAKFEWALDTENGGQWSTVTGDSASNWKSYAELEYSLNDGNRGTDISVDVYKSPCGWGDIFSVFGGQTYNPYQDEERTKWFEPGRHVLSNATMRMEQPNIGISTDGSVAAKSATINDIPSGESANFTLHLSNAILTNQDFNFSFDLGVNERSNQKGLEILMDGVPINGRSVLLNGKEITKKIITVRQTDQSVLDYDDIEICFMSQFQPLIIFDKVKLSAHFKPSSSPIDLAINQPVLNTETDTVLTAKLKNFNRQFKNLKYVGLQYRFDGRTQWTPVHTYVTNKKDSADVSYSMLPASGDLQFKLDMKDDNSYPQGTYYFRAFTTTPYGNENISVYSSEVKVVKDVSRPKALTTPTPANGILTYGDDLSIEFNENIVPGYVTAKNIIVSGKLNDQPINHKVALKLAPHIQLNQTINPVFLNGDFSTEMWLRFTAPGTILRQGVGPNSFSLGIDNQHHMVINIAGNQFKSQQVLPTNEWMFLVLSYHSNERKFSMLAQYGDNSIDLFTDTQISLKLTQTLNYVDDNYLYLGPDTLRAEIHDLALYSIYRDVADAASMKYVRKGNYQYGLVNHWPMDEGHGGTANDARHTHNMSVRDNWYIEGVNYGLHLTDKLGAHANISTTNTSRDECYAVEMWFKPSLENEPDAQVFQTGVWGRSNYLCLHYTNGDLVLDYGDKSRVVSEGHLSLGQNLWNHVALNVVRGQSAIVYLNGQRAVVVPETEVPPLEGATMRLAYGMKDCHIDELRIWKANLSSDVLLSNMYQCIDTTDTYNRGLVVYYPFEKMGIDGQGLKNNIPTIENLAPGKPRNLMTFTNANTTAESAPLKSVPQMQTVIASPVASERKVVINLQNTNASLIEGTTLNISIDKIHDLNGNESDPICWQVYVNRNNLKWLKDSVCIYKKYGESATFSVDIINQSGVKENFSIWNIPTWLSLNEYISDGGTLDPLKKMTLHFNVNPQVAVGNYNLTIGLEGNNGIVEPLQITMKVQGEMPNWTVDPSLFEHSMTTIGQMYIDGFLCENKDSRLAAFIDGECRGIAAPESIRGTSFVPLTIYGNEKDVNKPVTFRIWDAGTGIAYTNVNVQQVDYTGITKKLVSFSINGQVGSFDFPLYWSKGNEVEQTLPVKKNWNWIALGVQPVNQQEGDVLSMVTPWADMIKTKEKVSYCDGTTWDNELTIMGNMMYKLRLSRTLERTMPANITVMGNMLNRTSTHVVLKRKWNWIAYTPMITMDIDYALAGANPQVGDRIKSQTAFATYGPYGAWEGNLKALEPGHGYMYYSTENVEKRFVYPAPAAASRAGIMQIQSNSLADVQASIFTPVDGSDYSDNMTMVIKLVDDEASVDTAEVAAFVGGECRGAIRANEKGLYYLVIAGEGSGQPIELCTIFDGEVLTIDRSLTFTSDANIGTPWEPYVIDLRRAVGIVDVTAMPTDDGVWYTLQGLRIGKQRPTTPGVYIFNGQKKVVKRTVAE